MRTSDSSSASSSASSESATARRGGPLTLLDCEAVLFDCDGVLVESDACVEHSWTRWAVELGLDPRDVLAVVHGRRSADSVARLVPPARRKSALALIDRFELEDVHTTTAIAGAAELLATMPRERWATVTSGSRVLASARLRAAGLPVPEVLVTAEDVTDGKPHPEGYLTGARRLGIPPQRCAVLEDAPAGIRAARAARVGLVIGVGFRPLGDDLPDVAVRDLRGLTWTQEGLQVQGNRRSPTS